MRFGSLFSGIEAASAAWDALGWECAWVSEIEPFPCSVLAHHYPDIPNLGDVTNPDFVASAQALGPVELVCGGSPCQSFSVAGQHRSLDDERGGLSLRFVEVVNAISPRFVLWENVPGVLTTKDNAFGHLLAGLVGEDAPLLAPGGRWTDAGVVDGPWRSVAWRVLDAQYFSVAQRRRRVFLVAGRAGDRPHPAEILFEPESMRRRTPPSREAGQEITGTIVSRTNGGGGLGTDFDFAGGIQVVHHVVHTLRGEGFDGGEDGSKKGIPLVVQKTRVRKLMPCEAEKLQGFPGNYTLVPHRGKPAADGPRYKAIGNSWAVPVVRWIGERLEMLS